MSGPVGPAARTLGFAGLLPSCAGPGLMLAGRAGPDDLAWLPLVGGYMLAVVMRH